MFSRIRDRVENTGWAFEKASQRIEWAFVYDWMTTQQSLERVFVVFPTVAMRHVLPLWSLLVVLRWTIERGAASIKPVGFGVDGGFADLIRVIASWSAISRPAAPNHRSRTGSECRCTSASTRSRSARRRR